MIGSLLAVTRSAAPVLKATLFIGLPLIAIGALYLGSKALFKAYAELGEAQEQLVQAYNDREMLASQLESMNRQITDYQQMVEAMEYRNANARLALDAMESETLDQPLPAEVSDLVRPRPGAYAPAGNGQVIDLEDYPVYMIDGDTLDQEQLKADFERKVRERAQQ